MPMIAPDRGCVKTRFLAGTAKYYCGRSDDYGRMQHDLNDNLPSAVEPCARIRRDYVFTQPRPIAEVRAGCLPSVHVMLEKEVTDSGRDSHGRTGRNRRQLLRP